MTRMLVILVVLLLGCGGGGGGGNSSNTPVIVTNLDPSAIYSGEFGPSSNSANDVTNGIILPSGEARLMLRYGSQIVGTLQVTGSAFSCSATVYTSSGIQAMTMSNGKINQTTTNGGQANLSGSFTTNGTSDTFTIYSRQSLNEPLLPKTLTNLVRYWRAEANQQTSSLFAQGYIEGSIDTSGILNANIRNNANNIVGVVSAQFTQISPGTNTNSFRVTVQSGGQTYIGLAYTQQYGVDPDGFMIILASNSTGQFWAIFHH